MISSPYFHHALYSLACLSISINLVSTRRSTEQDKSLAKARISILESVKEQLSKNPQDDISIQRLMRLANKPAAAGGSSSSSSSSSSSLKVVLGDDVSWGDIFSGRTPSVVGKEEEMSRWEKEDLEKLRKEFTK